MSHRPEAACFLLFLFYALYYRSVDWFELMYDEEQKSIR